VEINNSCELNFGLVGTIKPVGNLAKNVGIRSMSVVEARGVDEEASLVTNLCLMYADIDCACKFLAFYAVKLIHFHGFLQYFTKLPTYMIQDLFQFEQSEKSRK
jgi:hypothetical protein